MAVYDLPHKLRDSFAALFVSKDPLPYGEEVQCIIHSILNKGYRSVYLHQALSQFCNLMKNDVQKQYLLSERSFYSPVYSEVTFLTHADCIQFFKELCSEILTNEEIKSDVIFLHLTELAKYLIVFNEVRQVRIERVNSLFDALFDFLHGYTPYEHSDTNLCTCKLYPKNEVCNCPIDVIVKNVLDSDDDNISIC